MRYPTVIKLLVAIAMLILLILGVIAIVHSESSRPSADQDRFAPVIRPYAGKGLRHARRALETPEPSRAGNRADLGNDLDRTPRNRVLGPIDDAFAYLANPVPDPPEPSPEVATPTEGEGVTPDSGPVYEPESDGLDWEALAECESGGDPTIVSSNGLWYGLYQFTIGTWQSVGGTGLPTEASPEEQLMRAQILYRRSGAGPWPNCGSLL